VATGAFLAPAAFPALFAISWRGGNSSSSGAPPSRSSCNGETLRISPGCRRRELSGCIAALTNGRWVYAQRLLNMAGRGGIALLSRRCLANGMRRAAEDMAEDSFSCAPRCLCCRARWLHKPHYGVKRQQRLVATSRLKERHRCRYFLPWRISSPLSLTRDGWERADGDGRAAVTRARAISHPASSSAVLQAAAGGG